MIGGGEAELGGLAGLLYELQISKHHVLKSLPYMPEDMVANQVEALIVHEAFHILSTGTAHCGTDIRVGAPR